MAKINRAVDLSALAAQQPKQELKTVNKVAPSQSYTQKIVEEPKPGKTISIPKKEVNYLKKMPKMICQNQWIARFLNKMKY